MVLVASRIAPRYSKFVLCLAIQYVSRINQYPQFKEPIMYKALIKSNTQSINITACEAAGGMVRARSDSETPSIAFHLLCDEHLEFPVEAQKLWLKRLSLRPTTSMGSSNHLPVPPPPPQWVLDLNDPPISQGKPAGVADPPGFSSSGVNLSKVRQNGIIFLISLSHECQKGGPASKQASMITPSRLANDDEMDTLKLKKAWELAIGPAKALPMSAIGMWMTGNSLQIFSVFMLYSLLKNPFAAITNTNATFSRLESERIKSKMLLVKLVFIMTNLLSVALGIYKIDKMGLLP